MKNLSIDQLYLKINDLIQLLQAYTENKNLHFIINSCRLKPYDYIFNGNRKLIVYKKWFDEFGNTIQIKNKKIILLYNDLELKSKNIICTDLYYGLSINKIAKISKLVYINTSKDEDFYQDQFIITFLGIDNYLRSYLYVQDEWQQVSPLLLGMKTLISIFKNLQVSNFLQLKNKNNIIPCLYQEEWLSSLPLGEEFLEIMKKKHAAIISLFD